MGRGGKRDGAGRPPGSKDPETLAKEKVQEAMRQRIYQIADSLLTPQISLAKGQQFLYKIEKTKIVGPKGGITYRPEKPKLVTNELEIKQYIDKLVDESTGDIEDENDPGATYYYITTKEPNNMAIDSLFNRVLGKPKESIELTGDEGGPVQLEYGITRTINKVYGDRESGTDSPQSGGT